MSTQPVAEIIDTLSDFARTLETLDKAKTDQNRLLADLDDRLTKLEGDEKKTATARVPLKQWVTWLADTYYYSPRLDGWETNTAMRAELQALKASHELTYNNSGTADSELRPRKGWDALHWHDALDRAMHRMADDKGSHQDRHDKTQHGHRSAKDINR